MNTGWNESSIFFLHWSSVSPIMLDIFNLDSTCSLNSVFSKTTNLTSSLRVSIHSFLFLLNNLSRTDRFCFVHWNRDGWEMFEMFVVRIRVDFENHVSPKRQNNFYFHCLYLLISICFGNFHQKDLFFVHAVVFWSVREPQRSFYSQLSPVFKYICFLLIKLSIVISTLETYCSFLKIKKNVFQNQIWNLEKFIVTNRFLDWTHLDCRTHLFKTCSLDYYHQGLN